MKINTSVSDIAIIKTLKDQVNSIQNEIFALQKRANSNVKFEHCYDMPVYMASQSIQVQDLISRSNANINNCTWSTNILSMQEEALTKVFNVISESQNLAIISSGNFGNSAFPNVKSDSENLLIQIREILNLSYCGMNIWNGSRTNETPLGNNILTGNPQDNYYIGDDFQLTIYTNDSTIEYGDNVNFACFKELISALQMMRDTSNITSYQEAEIAFTEIQQLLDKAQNGVASLLQKNGYIQQNVLANVAQNEAIVTHLSEIYSTTLNGNNEEDKAFDIVQASLVQKRLDYIIPLAMNFLKNVNIIDYI